MPVRTGPGGVALTGYRTSPTVGFLLSLQALSLRSPSLHTTPKYRDSMCECWLRCSNFTVRTGVTSGISCSPLTTPTCVRTSVGAQRFAGPLDESAECWRHLADHRAAVVDELGQHHGHVVVDGGRVVRPLSRVPHKRAQSKNGCTPHLQQHRCNTDGQRHIITNIDGGEGGGAIGGSPRARPWWTRWKQSVPSEDAGVSQAFPYLLSNDSTRP